MSTMKDERYLASIQGGRKEIEFTAKIYVGQDSRNPFHVHDDSYIMGIIGLQSPDEYEGGELVVASGTSELLNYDSPITRHGGSISFNRIGTLNLADLGSLKSRALYFQKPTPYRAVIWPEARSSEFLPAGRLMEHAVTPIKGNRYVGILSVRDL